MLFLVTRSLASPIVNYPPESSETEVLVHPTDLIESVWKNKRKGRAISGTAFRRGRPQDYKFLTGDRKGFHLAVQCCSIKHDHPVKQSIMHSLT